MFVAPDLTKSTKADLYRELAAQCRALIDDETDPVANMANCAALIFNSVPRLNWAGFYLLKGGELVLGPVPRAGGLRPDRSRAGRLWNGGGKSLDASSGGRDKISRPHRLR